MEITVTYIRPPIPVREYDWCATLADADVDSKIGYGATKVDAAADLLDQLDLSVDVYAALIRGLSRENDAVDEARAESICSMGVGCGTAGVCYAAANGHPELCEKK